MEEEQAIIFARKEAKFRLQQQSELQALLKRIEVRRKEHLKQLEIDSKRLLQRNRNVQAVLESKQTVESHRLHQEIKKNLFQNSLHGSGSIRSSHNTNAASKKSNRNTNEITKQSSQEAMGTDDNNKNSKQKYKSNDFTEEHADFYQHDSSYDPPSFMKADGPKFN